MIAIRRHLSALERYWISPGSAETPRCLFSVGFRRSQSTMTVRRPDSIESAIARLALIRDFPSCGSGLEMVITLGGVSQSSRMRTFSVLNCSLINDDGFRRTSSFSPATAFVTTGTRRSNGKTGLFEQRRLTQSHGTDLRCRRIAQVSRIPNRSKTPRIRFSAGSSIPVDSSRLAKRGGTAQFAQNAQFLRIPRNSGKIFAALQCK